MKQYNRTRRCLVWLLVSVMGLSCLSGCKRSATPSNPEGWETAVEKGELEIQVGLRGDGGKEKWTEDNFTIEREEVSAIDEDLEEEIEESISEESEELVEAEVSEETEVETTEETEAVETEESAVETSTVEEKSTATVSAAYINPLSGETMAEDVSLVRPYIFAFNDHLAAMPQMGISQSDLIVEYLIESAVTRYTAFFMPWKMEGMIGPIHGTRGVTSELTIGYDGILVHCGGNADSINLLESHKAERLDESASYIPYDVMFRDPTRQTYGSEHSLFADGAKVIEFVQSAGLREDHMEGFDATYGLHFSANAVSQCKETAKTVEVVFDGGKTTTFTYRDDLKGYTVNQFGYDLVDANGEDPEAYDVVSFANVINLYAPAELMAGGVYVANNLSQGGEGTFFTGGKAVAIRWTKGGVEDVFHFTLEDGTPLELSIGRTYICINQDGTTPYRGSCSWE